MSATFNYNNLLFLLKALEANDPNALKQPVVFDHAYFGRQHEVVALKEVEGKLFLSGANKNC